MNKLTVVGCSLLAMLVLVPKSANAATNTTCTVTGVMWAKYMTPTTINGTSVVPTDQMMILCSDGNGYDSHIGTASQVAQAPMNPPNNPFAGCYATADAVKSMESLAVSARLSGKTLTIWWTARSCPGNAGQRSVDSVTLN